MFNGLGESVLTVILRLPAGLNTKKRYSPKVVTASLYEWLSMYGYWVLANCQELVKVRLFAAVTSNGPERSYAKTTRVTLRRLWIYAPVSGSRRTGSGRVNDEVYFFPSHKE